MFFHNSFGLANVIRSFNLQQSRKLRGKKTKTTQTLKPVIWFWLFGWSLNRKYPSSYLTK